MKNVYQNLLLLYFLNCTGSALRSKLTLLVKFIALFILSPLSAQAAPFVFVPGANSNSVTVIDVANDNNNIVATIPLAPACMSPIGITINPAGTFAYVACGNSNSLAVINTQTATVAATIPMLAANPVAVAVTATRAYVVSQSNVLTEINTLTNTVVNITNLVALGGSSRIAINPAGTRAFVSNFAADSVTVLDITVSPATIITTFAVGTEPIGIVVNPAGTLAYVANQGSGTVSVIDADAAMPFLMNTVPIAAGAGSRGIAINPAGTSVFVANVLTHTISVIDTTTNMVVGTANLPMGSTGPVEVVVNPAGTRFYTANNGSSNVSGINTGTNMVSGPVVPLALNAAPLGIALSPLGPAAAAPQQPLAVPTLSESALLFMALLLAAIAVHRLRKQ